MNSMLNFLKRFLPSSDGDSDLTDEKIEEYRMLSSFEPREIVRLRQVFLKATLQSEKMDKNNFFSLNCISINPLKDRIAVCFGFNLKSEIDFPDFLLGVAAFNSTGRREQKLKIAFKIQDMDDDGVLSKEDLKQYIKIITNNNLPETEVDELISKVFLEAASDADADVITYSDFHSVVSKTDFQTKLHLQI